MGFFVTLGVIGLCMAIMAVGVILKGKAVRKDCGLDPISGERVGHCRCADEGAEPGTSDCETRSAVRKVVSLHQR